MKKTLIFLLLSAVPATMAAQFQVLSDGTAKPVDCKEQRKN
jgi:hypothetical protein